CANGALGQCPPLHGPGDSAPTVRPYVPAAPVLYSESALKLSDQPTPAVRRKRTGMAMKHATARPRCRPGLNRCCITASIAASLSTSDGDDRISGLSGRPSCVITTLTTTIPSMPACRAMVGYLTAFDNSATPPIISGCSSTTTKISGSSSTTSSTGGGGGLAMASGASISSVTSRSSSSSSSNSSSGTAMGTAGFGGGGGRTSWTV